MKGGDGVKYGILTFDEPVPDISRKILHVDMDAFYANVEIRDNPHLAKHPVVIARHPNLTGGRGIVATCNYIARQYGIHSAMSSVEALKRCPKAVFVPGRMDYYRQISRQIREIFYRYTDLVEPLSLDEAYLDVTHNKLHLPSATLIAREIQQAIYRELDLTCSIGVSYNKFIAKMASDIQKPCGLTIIPPDQALQFLEELPIEEFYGVGEKSVDHFKAQGIYSGRDLLEWDLKSLIDEFGKMGKSLYFKVRGIHNSPVTSHRQRKSVGKERTLRQPHTLDSQVLETFEKLSRQVADRLQELQLVGNTVTIKIRYSTFETLTRQCKLSHYIFEYENLYGEVLKLWQAHGHVQEPIRLLGVTVSGFDDNPTEIIELPLG